ncbi:MAG: histidine triad nucleotide-binding protein [Coriobacteriia bacterium]|nr:histidine triad nucleotide-binding protein [Coriobacteriia bacterium]
MQDCLFCKIAAGEIGGPHVYEDEMVVAFDDISPQAPVHTLIIPKQHCANLNDEPDVALLGHILQVAHEVARIKGIDQSGYRVVQNNGPDAGQTVFHLHFHVIGGKELSLGMA